MDLWILCENPTDRDTCILEAALEPWKTIESNFIEKDIASQSKFVSISDSQHQDLIQAPKSSVQTKTKYNCTENPRRASVTSERGTRARRMSASSTSSRSKAFEGFSVRNPLNSVHSKIKTDVHPARVIEDFSNWSLKYSEANCGSFFLGFLSTTGRLQWGVLHSNGVESQVNHTQSNMFTPEMKDERIVSKVEINAGGDSDTIQKSPLALIPTWDYITSADPIPVGQWTHVALVHYICPLTGVSRAQLFMNGALQGESDVVAPPILHRPIILLGASIRPDMCNFRGKLHSLRFWKRPLSEVEVACLWHPHIDFEEWDRVLQVRQSKHYALVRIRQKQREEQRGMNAMMIKSSIYFVCFMPDLSSSPPLFFYCSVASINMIFIILKCYIDACLFIYWLLIKPFTMQN